MKGKTAHGPVVSNKEIQMKGEGKQGRGFLFLFSTGHRHGYPAMHCAGQGTDVIQLE